MKTFKQELNEQKFDLQEVGVLGVVGLIILVPILLKFFGVLLGMGIMAMIEIVHQVARTGLTFNPATWLEVVKKIYQYKSTIQPALERLAKDPEYVELAKSLARSPQNSFRREQFKNYLNSHLEKGEIDNFRQIYNKSLADVEADKNKYDRERAAADAVKEKAWRKDNAKK